MQKRAKRWIIVLLLGCAVGIAWFVWHTLHTVSQLDIREEAARADAVVLGTLRKDRGQRSVVIAEIWKSAPELKIGSTIPVPQLPRDAHPERLVVFLERSSRGTGLRAGTIAAVVDGQVGWPKMSLEDAKALCTTPPGI